MKARWKELLDKAIAATATAVEVHNQPRFLYREEAFAVLAANGWELLLKAKWLRQNDSQIGCLYVREKGRVKPTRSGNPFTHGADYLARKLVESKVLDPAVYANLQALLEIRDCAVHFFTRAGLLSRRLEGISGASVRNFICVVGEWFQRDVSKLLLTAIPLSCGDEIDTTMGQKLSSHETRFLKFLEDLEQEQVDDNTGRFAVSVRAEVRLVGSRRTDALPFRPSNDPNATPLRVTDEEFFSMYPWSYEELTRQCRQRYRDFKQSRGYHSLRKRFECDPLYCQRRVLNPGSPKSASQLFWSQRILSEFDKHYTRKKRANAETGERASSQLVSRNKGLVGP
jgi:hypothetical protein